MESIHTSVHHTNREQHVECGGCSLPTMRSWLLFCSVAVGEHTTARRTGVLVHGCHCGAEGWERIVWGDPRSGALGRIPSALRLALREPCCAAILFGTGASNHPETGLLEGQATLALARARCCR